MRNRFGVLASATLLLALSACGDTARLPAEAGTGANPELPPPHRTAIPTVHIAQAKGWSGDATPQAADGLAVRAYASGLDHPRWVYVLPNGDVLVAETNAPPKPEDGKGIKGWIMKKAHEEAPARAFPARTASRCCATPMATASPRRARCSCRDSTRPSAWRWSATTSTSPTPTRSCASRTRAGATQITAPGVKVADLPAGPINHHWTKNIIASRDGTRLYATVGSNSNVAENGMEEEERRAAILEVDLATGRTRRVRVRAAQSQRPRLAAADRRAVDRRERARRARQRPRARLPDVGAGRRVLRLAVQLLRPARRRRGCKPPRPDLVAKAIVPDYALGSHVAPAGTAFSTTAGCCPRATASGAFIGEHGSWNRKPRSGYKVVFVPFAGGRPAGKPQDVLTGFVNAAGEAQGRPVGVAVDGTGALLVADDVGNTVWRVTPGLR